MQSNLIYYGLTSFALMVPQLVIIIIGIIFAVRNLSRTPMVSKLALLGLVLMLLVGLLGVAIYIVQIYIQFGNPGFASLFTNIATVVRGVFNVIGAVGLGLLIYAIWTERSEK